MGDLIRLIKHTNSAAWYRALPTSFPVLLVSGEDDPVGNYGKGVREVERKLRAQGREVTCRLYTGARHEILNDFTYEETRNDIIKFCSKQ
jgi:alpha-beta hydrolase superfamily lysophospholipase